MMRVKPMSGAGRFKPARRVRDVQTVPCPAWTGCHELTNDRGANTYCVHCSGSWADLDTLARQPKPLREVVDEYLAAEGAS